MGVMTVVRCTRRSMDDYSKGQPFEDETRIE